MPDGEDPDTLIQGGGRESMEMVLDQALPLVDFKVEFFRRQGKLNTPQGRGEAVRALLETVRRMPDRIARQFAAHEIAQKMDLDERLVAREMGLVKAPEDAAQAVQSIQPGRLSQFDRMLEDLLYVLVHFPDHRSAIFQTLPSNQMENHPLHPLFSTLEAAWVEGNDVQQADLLNTLHDRPELIDHVSGILNQSTKMGKEQVLDIVHKTPLTMKRMALQEQIAQLREELKGRSDPSLLQDYHTLKKELDEIRSQLPSDR
jgi:DNA primase